MRSPTKNKYDVTLVVTASVNYTVYAHDESEAVAIASDNPHLEHPEIQLNDIDVYDIGQI